MYFFRSLVMLLYFEAMSVCGFLQLILDCLKSFRAWLKRSLGCLVSLIAASSALGIIHISNQVALLHCEPLVYNHLVSLLFVLDV